MVEPRKQEPSISRQCQLLDLSRSSYYYTPVPVKAEDLKLMRKIDELYLQHPCWGSRSMVRQHGREGIVVNRKHVQRLMRLMGIEAVQSFFRRINVNLWRYNHKYRLND
jgi:putative transposase